MTVRIGGLFEGYGGLTMAVQHALGGGELTWYSEYEPPTEQNPRPAQAAARLLAQRHPRVPNLGDITAVDWSQVEPVDVLAGGFPCQDVSFAGHRAGLTVDSRSGLWWHFAAAIGRLRPGLVVIENVPGLLTARGAEPTPDLLAAWAERDRLARILALIDSKHRRAVREGKAFHVQQHATDRVRILGLHKRAVAAVRRADAGIVRAIGAVLGSLATLGYDAVWCGLRASDVGACHERLRIFVCAWPAGSHPAGERRRPAGWDDGLRAAGQEPKPAAHHPEGDGRDARRAEPARLIGRPDAALGGDGTAADPAGLTRPGDGHPVAGDGSGAVRAGQAEPGRRGGSTADSERGGGDRRAAVQGRGSAGGDAGGRHRADAATDPDGDGCSRLGRQQPGQRDADRCGGADIAWGKYEPAIRRWERVLGRPAPTPTELTGKGTRRLSPRFEEWMMGLPDGWVTDPALGLTRNEQMRLIGNGVVPLQGATGIRWCLARRRRNY